METFSHVCPRCSENLKLDYVAGNGVCSCGFIDNKSFEKTLEARDTRLLKIYTGISFGILVGFFHMMSWGGYAAEIPFLKIGQWTGMLGPSGYEKIVEACVHQNKWSCAENAYVDLAKKTGNAEAYARAAHLEFQIGDIQSSVKSYETYFAAGGKDSAIAIQYAVVLEKAGDMDKAMTYLNMAVAQSGEKLPAVATGEMLKILMTQQKYVEAQDLIATFWDSAENAKGYFNTEYDQLKKLAGPHRRGHSVAKLK